MAKDRLALLQNVDRLVLLNLIRDGDAFFLVPR